MRRAGIGAPQESGGRGSSIDPMLNPHIPKFITHKPWYTDRINERGERETEEDKLVHHRLGLHEPVVAKETALGSRPVDRRSRVVHRAKKFRKGACRNCGSMGHKSRDCLERKRRRGAHLTNKNIAPDLVVPDRKSTVPRAPGSSTIPAESSYSVKHDNWASFDPKRHVKEVQRRHAVLEQARVEILSQKLTESHEQLKQLVVDEDRAVEDEGTETDAPKKQSFAMVPQASHGKVRTNIRNIRVRESTAKYLLNMEEDAPFYDPKTRSMRGNPTPADGEAFYRGDNAERYTGGYRGFREMAVFAAEARKRGQKIEVSSEPSQTELGFREYLKKKQSMLSETQKVIQERYEAGTDADADADAKGGAVAEEGEGPGSISEFKKPKKPKVGVDMLMESTGTRRPVPNSSVRRRRIVHSKYDEDILHMGHSEIFGSLWRDGRWGYACCGVFKKNVRCNRSRVAEAAAAAGEGAISSGPDTAEVSRKRSREELIKEEEPPAKRRKVAPEQQQGD